MDELDSIFFDSTVPSVSADTTQVCIFPNDSVLTNVDLPQYYREGFFSEDSLFHPELEGGRYGVAGDPVPYSIHADSVLTGLLLFCFMLAVVAFAGVKDFIVRQTKSFFYISYENIGEVHETATDLRFQFYLVALSSLLLALLYYLYTILFIGETFILDSQYYLIAIYLAIFMLYYMAKSAIYYVVNGTLFDSKRNVQWLRSYLFITSVEGVLLIPALLMLAYLSLSVEIVTIYVVIALLIVKILTLYKSYHIFFSRNVVKLQIILYFCALELVPMLFLWSTLDITANILKIKI